MRPLPSSALPCLSQLPRPISPFPSGRFLRVPSTSHYFFFFAAFLAFLFFAITGLHQRLRKQNEVRPYCDGLSNRRNEPRRIEFLRLSTSGASGPEEKSAFNISRSPKKYFRRITHNRESSKNYFAAKRRAQHALRLNFEAQSIRTRRSESSWTVIFGATRTQDLTALA